jgi:hypothetical protein
MSGLSENYDAPHLIYDLECFDSHGRPLWQEMIRNLVTDQGANHLLDTYFAGSGYTAAWYLHALCWQAISLSTKGGDGLGTELNSGRTALTFSTGASGKSKVSAQTTITSYDPSPNDVYAVAISPGYDWAGVKKNLTAAAWDPYYPNGTTAVTWASIPDYTPVSLSIYSITGGATPDMVGLGLWVSNNQGGYVSCAVTEYRSATQLIVLAERRPGYSGNTPSTILGLWTNHPCYGGVNLASPRTLQNGDQIKATITVSV